MMRLQKCRRVVASGFFYTFIAHFSCAVAHTMYKSCNNTAYFK